MALVRTQTQIPSTYEELTFRLLRSLPSGYQRIHIIADTYRSNSIKDPERLKRGCADKVIIHSAKSKIPRNFNDFLQNGENKSRLIEIILSVILERKEDALSLLKCKEMYFSTDGACHKTTEHETVFISELSSNQEEADTKLCLHAQHALATNGNGIVYVRSHSGDVDINVILISKILDNSERVILDFNKGKHSKVLRLADVEMTDDEEKP